MSNNSNYTEQGTLDNEQSVQNDPSFDLLCDRIEDGKVIPVVSNAVFNELLFDMERLKEIASTQFPYLNHIRESPLSWNIEDELAVVWAQQRVNYPLPEQHWLPRVAMYDRVINNKDAAQAKSGYLKWLKELLISQAAGESDVDDDVTADLLNDRSLSFSDIAYLLGCPYLVGDNSPPQVLARLNLPIYVTTSPFDFLERAIKTDGRDVQTQVCFWSDVPADVDESHLIDRDYKPKPDEPLVYHLFGLEKYPSSMVLNEDDYLDFLMKISVEVDQEDQLVPLCVTRGLAQSSLLLLGYRLRDWEFRVMFRGLLKSVMAHPRNFSTAIQIDPCQNCDDEASGEIEAKVHEYLETYFEKASFEVAWSTPQAYTNELAKRLVSCGCQT